MNASQKKAADALLPLFKRTVAACECTVALIPTAGRDNIENLCSASRVMIADYESVANAPEAVTAKELIVWLRTGLNPDLSFSARSLEKILIGLEAERKAKPQAVTLEEVQDWMRQGMSVTSDDIHDAFDVITEAKAAILSERAKPCNTPN